MKYKKIIFSLFAFPCIWASSITGVDAASGYVDIDFLLRTSPEFQLASQKIKNEYISLQKKYEKNAKGKSDKEKRLLAQSYQKTLAQKHQQLMDPIQKKIYDAITKIAKDKQLDLVIIPGSAVYGKPDVDITNDVKRTITNK